MGQTSEKTETYPYYFIEIFERDEIYFENSEQANYFYFKPNQEFFKDFLSACINNNFEVYATIEFFYLNFIQALLKYCKYNLLIPGFTKVNLYVYRKKRLQRVFKPKYKTISKLCPFLFASAIAKKVDLNNLVIEDMIYSIFIVYAENQSTI